MDENTRALQQTQETVLKIPGSFGPHDYVSILSKISKKAEIASGDVTERFFQIDGHSIRLRFAGPALVSRITPALAHLATQSCQFPDLTINLWDSVSTRTDPPPLPWDRGGPYHRGERWVYNDGRFDSLFMVAEEYLTLLDKQENQAFYWISDVAKVTYHENSVPLRSIFYWWLRTKGYHIVHGGGVGTEQGGVLIGGNSGYGKSTTTLACLDSRLKYLGDDNCLFKNSPKPHAYCLYHTAKLNEDNVKRLPYLNKFISNPHQLEEEKALFFLNDHFSHKVIEKFPIRAVLIPQVTGQKHTRLKKISPVECLKHLAPSTLTQVPGENSSTFRAMANLVRSVPCFRIETGTDLSQIPKVILGLVGKEEVDGE